MATLDTAFYPGEDRYSDGDAEENRILEIVRAGKKLSDLTREEATWPVIYHLSPVRENICNWYPFAPGSRILEVGAGCGAVTGALCRSGCEVFSVDLSLRRSTINYERHRDCDYLHIFAGNLNDIVFSERFDYVTLNGVLEYAGRFTPGEDPYRTFLENIREKMKPTGRLLLAIENRMGLKYMAGAAEDHLGKAYAGLRGYDPADGIRTFSRSELATLLERSGFSAMRFFYPYPDYKFPMEIFTEETLQSGHYGKPYLVFDQDRTLLFPEEPVASVLAEDGAAGALANSFLVEAGLAAWEPEEKTIYVRQNNERREDLRIGTRIFEKNHEKRVEKYALSEAARAHLQTILENERRMSAVCSVCFGTEGQGRITYPYLSDPTLENRLRQAVREQDREKALQVFRKLHDLIFAGAEPAGYGGEGFESWFGPETAGGEALCVNPANIDLMPDNVFDRPDGLTVTDVEWLADFPVPAAFVMWRCIRRTYAAISGLEDLIPEKSMLEMFGIGTAEVPVYKAWSRHFENEYVSPGNGNRFSRNVLHADTDLAGLIAEKKRLEAENHELSQRLREILDSRSWRALEIPRKIGRRLFPRGGTGKSPEEKGKS